MKKNINWEQFLKTGKVEYYLKYRQEVSKIEDFQDASKKQPRDRAKSH